MKKLLNQFVSILLTAALLFGVVMPRLPVQAAAASAFTSYGGWNETLYATISGITDEEVTAVTYSGPVSGSLTGEDFQYLVRNTSGGVRVDVLGLKAGTYSLTVKTTSGDYTQEGITVNAQDRSGFAHDGYTEGVGAYNDDGTLKDNTVVLYVTNSNKNSLELSCGGVTVAGIGHILNSAGREATPGSGLTSQGGMANNNQGILKKLAEADIPLCVRIIGNVSTPDGVTEFDSVNYGGIDNDNGSMVRMTNCKNITIEGVGASAIANGWGFSFIAGSGDYALDYGKNFEVRNIRFENVPEDCVGLEGQQSGDTLPDPIRHCWIHNNTFISPYFPDAPEADKRNGDGACDWKRGLYYTNSYNYYDGYKKTNLVGSNDDCLQYHATFHHNYWDDCAARAPLVRKADVHMYNNIWYSMVDYCISPRASSYVFYEYGYFVENGDVLESSGDTDGYANVYENNKNDPAADVTDKAATIKSSRLAGTYVERGDYSLQTDIEEMKTTVYTQAGSQRASDSSSLDPDAPEDESQTGGNAGGFVHNFTAHGTESAFYTITGSLATNKGKVTYNGLTLTQCLVMNSTSASVSFTAPCSGTFTMVFGGSTSDKNNTILLDGGAKTIDSNNTMTTAVEAGSHTVVKKDTVHLWYMAFVPDEAVEEPTLAPTEAPHTHSYTASVTTAPGCESTGVKTYTCSCGDSYTESVPATGHSYSASVTAPTCTAQGYTTYTCANCGGKYVGDYVAASGHSYANGTCTVCGAADPDYTAPVELFDLAGANMKLGSDLTMYFYVNKADLSGSAYYIELVKSNPDGSTATTTYQFAEWENYSSSMYRVGFSGIAAKQMCDDLNVTVYASDGTKVSNTWTDSVRDYAIRMLNKNTSANKTSTLMADMLNYGAAAQQNFGYNTADLANSTMTATHQSFASQNFSMGNFSNNAVSGTGFIGSSLSLNTNICLTLYFNGSIVNESMKAVVSYTDHYGNAQTYEVSGSEFVTSGTYKGVEINVLTAADAESLVTVEIYNGSTLVASASDSVESYAVRKYASNSLFVELMKFASSAYTYFHS